MAIAQQKVDQQLAALNQLIPDTCRGIVGMVGSEGIGAQVRAIREAAAVPDLDPPASGQAQAGLIAAIADEIDGLLADIASKAREIVAAAESAVPEVQAHREEME